MENRRYSQVLLPSHESFKVLRPLWKKNHVKNLISLLLRYLDFCKFLTWKSHENVHFGIKSTCKSLPIFIKRNSCGICTRNKLISRLNSYHLSYRDTTSCRCAHFYSGMKSTFMLRRFVLKSRRHGDLRSLFNFNNTCT